MNGPSPFPEQVRAVPPQLLQTADGLLPTSLKSGAISDLDRSHFSPL
jgi:hypothetical protein